MNVPEESCGTAAPGCAKICGAVKTRNMFQNLLLALCRVFSLAMLVWHSRPRLCSSLLPSAQKGPNILIQEFGILRVTGCTGGVSPQ